MNRFYSVPEFFGNPGKKKGSYEPEGGDQYIIWLDRFYQDSHAGKCRPANNVPNATPVIILFSLFIIYI